MEDLMAAISDVVGISKLWNEQYGVRHRYARKILLYQLSSTKPCFMLSALHDINISLWEWSIYIPGISVISEAQIQKLIFNVIFRPNGSRRHSIREVFIKLRDCCPVCRADCTDELNFYEFSTMLSACSLKYLIGFFDKYIARIF